MNERWGEASPVHLAASVMWRLSGLHPFADGNGRTSRIASYLVLSIAARILLPGTPTIPDQIVDNRKPHRDAADVAWMEGRLDISAMEDLLGAMLERQISSFRSRQAD